jgi:hypothetical protein
MSDKLEIPVVEAVLDIPVVESVLSTSTFSAMPECHPTASSSEEKNQEEVKNQEEEEKCYNFLLVNYLLYRCNRLSNEAIIELSNLQKDWINHVEEQEGVSGDSDLKMDVFMAYSFAKDRFADNPLDLQLFVDIAELEPSDVNLFEDIILFEDRMT